MLHLFVCFVPSLFSCHEKATMALYFGRTRWICCLFEATKQR